MSITVKKENEKKRIDVMLSEEYPEYSRSIFQKLLSEERIEINGKVAKKSEKLKEGDLLKFEMPQLKAKAVPIPRKMDLNILYEDEALLVVNKPAGLTVHLGNGKPEDTLVDGLLYHTEGKLSDVNGSDRPGIVHRIDKDTSGLLVVAKTNEIHVDLATQLEKHSITRRYFAIAHGRFSNSEGIIDTYIIRDPKNRVKKRAVSLEKGEELKDNSKRRAITHYKVIDMLEKWTYMSLRLETGRTHQIRVHLASLGHAIVGDPLYGKGKTEFGVSRQMLHAGVLGFVHPLTKEYMEFSTDAPEDFVNVLEKLRKMK